MYQVKNAVILLAGLGSRLRPLTDKMHKSLISVGGQTILERQINQLLGNGIEKFHLVLGYRSKDIKNFAQHNFASEAKFFYYDNPIYDQTNNAYSLMQAIQNLADSFILLDGDVLLSDQALQKLFNGSPNNQLLCDTDKTKLDDEAVKFKINSKNEILNIGKNVPLNQAAGESIGVGLYQKDWLEILNINLSQVMKDKKNWQIYYEDAMQNVIERKQAPSPLKLISTEDAPWVEVDDQDDLKRAKNLFN